MYLNHSCISFESDCAVPFTASFAVQLLCFNPDKVKNAGSSDFGEIAQKAIEEEITRRHSSLLSFPSYASSTTESPLSKNTSSDVPLLWKGVQEPGASRNVGLLDDSNMDLNLDCSEVIEHETSKSAQPSPVEDQDDQAPIQLPSNGLSIRLSSNQLPKKKIRKRSFSDDYSTHSNVLSHLSLAYGIEFLQNPSSVRVQLPPPRSKQTKRRELSSIEKEWLSKEGGTDGNRLSIDPLFSDCQPIDKKVAITPIISLDDPINSEVILSPLPRSPKSERHLGIAQETCKDVSQILTKLITMVHDGRSWKMRFLVLTERFLQIMRKAGDDDYVHKIQVTDMGPAVFCCNVDDVSICFM